MVDAAPFRALRYNAEVAGDATATSAPAYDDFDRFDYARHRTASPYTVLELLAPRDPGGYAAAGAAYRRWRRTGVLEVDPEPGFHIYEQHELRHGVPTLQRGVLAAVRVSGPVLDPTIAVHEEVDTQRVHARMERLVAVPADLAPVFMIATSVPPPLGELLGRPPTEPPIARLTDEQGVDHRVWSRTAPDQVRAFRELLTDVRVLVADGHHRYAAAQALARATTGPGPASRTLAHIVDAGTYGPQVLAVHRLVRRLPTDWEQQIRAEFTIVPAPARVDALLARLEGEGPGVVAVARADGAWFLRPNRLQVLRDHMPGGATAAWRALDTALVDSVLLPRLGIPPGEVEHRVDAPATLAQLGVDGLGALILVRPVDVATVLQIVDGGERMPAKSTSFRPKPRAGLVMRAIEE